VELKWHQPRKRNLGVKNSALLKVTAKAIVVAVSIVNVQIADELDN
jgi:hypothetical protein